MSNRDARGGIGPRANETSYLFGIAGLGEWPNARHSRERGCGILPVERLCLFSWPARAHPRPARLIRIGVSARTSAWVCWLRCSATASRDAPRAELGGTFGQISELLDRVSTVEV
jgi:hypothetical protein